MKHAGIDLRTVLASAAAVALAAGGILYWRRRRHRDPEEVERQRRSRLNHVGRIVEGEVIEIREAPSGDSARSGRRLVWYTYSISGVTYETTQDITGLEERICLDRLVAGLPASVKYDPANPSNSILVADDWSGFD